jgi:hypothetical protein
MDDPDTIAIPNIVLNAKVIAAAISKLLINTKEKERRFRLFGDAVCVGRYAL